VHRVERLGEECQDALLFHCFSTSFFWVLKDENKVGNERGKLKFELRTFERDLEVRTKQSAFQQALEMVETLPAEQQSDLVDVIRRRLIEQRRDEIAASIRLTKADCRAGRVKKGTVADLMRDLRP
jgi:hypothetical protein